MSIETDVAAWLIQLKSTSAGQRADAARHFATLGEHVAAVAAAIPLVEACADSDDQVRQWAEAALESFGPPRVKDVVPLAALAGRENLSQAFWAATLLGRLGQCAAGACDALQQVAATHADAAVAKRAAWALGKIGTGPKNRTVDT
ncbi:MAG: hypothetical protein K8U03_08940 [Planctomycetia bacterium]|nr:hypothetical protein [Planctomycetia bacterium]